MNSKSSVSELRQLHIKANQLADDMSKLSSALSDLYVRSSLGIEFDDESSFLLLKFSGCAHLEDVSQEAFIRYKAALAQLHKTKVENEQVREI